MSVNSGEVTESFLWNHSEIDIDPHNRLQRMKRYCLHKQSGTVGLSVGKYI